MGWWDRLMGRAAPPRMMVEPPVGRVIGQLPIAYQLQRIGGSLTPQQVSSILREADIGQMWRLVDLANEARQKDCTLQSVLHTREMALNTLEWRVVAAKKPGREEATARDTKVAEFVENALRQANGRDGEPDARSFVDMVAHLTGAAFMGYAFAETLWRKDGSSLVPEAFVLHSQRRFNFTPAGRLVWWDLIAGGLPTDVLVDYPGLFIVHQPRINGDVACREGLVRPLMWAALFRNWDQRDWMALAELAWKPWRTGKYKRGATKEDKDAAVSILEGMTSSGVAVYPETIDVMVEWPKAMAQSSHEALANFLGAEMAKATLGQTLTTEQGKVGSQALGAVHNEIRKDIRDGDAKSVAAAIRRYLVAPIVQLNFGDVAMPDFEFVVEETADLGVFSTAVKTFVDAGLKVPTEWIYDQAGIPEPDDDDDVIGGEEVDVTGLQDPADPNAPPQPGEPAPADAPKAAA